MPATELATAEPDADRSQTGAAAWFAVPAGAGVVLLLLLSSGTGQSGVLNRAADGSEVTALRLDLTAPVPSVSRVELPPQLSNLLGAAAPAVCAPAPSGGAVASAAGASDADLPGGITTSAGGGLSTSADLGTDRGRPSGGAAGGGPAGAKLSARERQVLGFIAAGCTHEQTAHRMGVRKSTVNTYIERIRAKLGPGNKADLTRAALLLDAVHDPA